MKVDSETDSLDFYVFGKRIESDIDEDFKVISVIQIPFEEIITALKVKFFTHELIPSCYLEFSYDDKSENAPYRE
jgi:hypothetical protein